MRDPSGQRARRRGSWQQLPASGSAVAGASVIMEGGKPVLKLELTERPEDIFVETQTTAYFRAPVFSADGREARLAIDNLKRSRQACGHALTLTYRLGGRGLEQTVTLP